MQNLPLFARIRKAIPLDSHSRPPCVSCQPMTSPTVLFVSDPTQSSSPKPSTGNQIYHFQEVFDGFLPNEAVYNRVVRPLSIDALGRGSSFCSLVVGGHSSGKKHSVFNGDAKDKGMLFLAFDDIRAEVEPIWKRTGVQSIKRFIQASCVHGDQVYDLLTGKPSSFRIHEKFERENFEVIGAGLSEKPVKNMRELITVMEQVNGNLKRLSSGSRSSKAPIYRKPVVLVSLILVPDSSVCRPKTQISFVLLNTDEAWSGSNSGTTESLIDYLNYVQTAELPSPSAQNLYLKNKLTTLLRESCNEKSQAVVLGCFGPCQLKSALNCLSFLGSLSSQRQEQNEPQHLTNGRLESETERQIKEIRDEVLELPGLSQDLSQEKMASIVLGIEYRMARILNGLNKEVSSGRNSHPRQKECIQALSQIQELLKKFKVDSELSKRKQESNGSLSLESQRLLSSPSGVSRSNYAEHRSSSSGKIERQERGRGLIERPFGENYEDIRYVNMEKDINVLHESINEKRLMQIPRRSRSRSSQKIPEPQELILESPLSPLEKAKEELSELRKATNALKEEELCRISREEKMKEELAVLEEHLHSKNQMADKLAGQLGNLHAGIERELSIANEQNETLRHQLMEATRNADLKIGVITQLEETLKKERIESEKTMDRFIDLEKRYKTNIDELLRQIDDFRIKADRLVFEKQELINRLEQSESNQKRLEEKADKVKMRAEKSIAEILEEKGTKISKQRMKIRDLRNQIKEANAREQRFEEEFGNLKVEIEKMRISKGASLSDLDKTQRELMVNKRENGQMKKEIEKLKEELREISKNAEEFEEEGIELSEKNQKLRLTLAETESQLVECKNEMQVDMEIISKLQAENKRINEQAEAQKETVIRLENQLKFVQQSSYSVKLPFALILSQIGRDHGK